MIRYLAIAGVALLGGCEPPGQKTTDLTGGYQLIKHDGLRQVIRGDGNITVDHVADARVDGPVIRATVENGTVVEVDSRSGDVRTISGEAQ
jgi:hypothetical protein